MLKDLYFGAEDAYYKFLDRIDAKIPIYKIVDPIDRVVPSFALLLVVVVLLLAYGAFMLLGGLPGAATIFTIAVVDESGSAVPNAVVSFAYSPEQPGLPAEQETDDFGQVVLPWVPLGTVVTAEVSHGDFEVASGSFEMADSPEQYGSIVLAEVLGLTRTVRLVDSLGQPVLDSVTITFSCSNIYATPPPAMPVVGGTAYVEMPNNCETLFVSVSSTGYDAVDMVALSDGDNLVYLSASVVEYGTIIVNVNSAVDGSGIDNVMVELYKYNELATNPNIGPVDHAPSYGGQVIFSNKYPDTYVLKTYDVSGQYGDEASGSVSLTSGATETYTFSLQENVIGNVIIQAVDSATQAGIADATIKLSYASTNDQIAELTADSTGTATFPVTRDVDYRVFVEAENYVLGKATVRVSAAVQQIELDTCTPQTCGLLVVSVIDEDGLPVENAWVALYSGATGFLAGYSERITDVNGIARFAGVSSGSYWAYAFKQGGTGSSDTKYFSSATSDEDVDMTVTMTIGKGTIRVNVVDDYGVPIPMAVVNIYNASNGELVGSDYAGADGNYSHDLKADKKVYVVATKRTPGAMNYADYITVAKPIISSSVTAFNIAMEPQIVDREVEIEFLGLHKKGLVVSGGSTPALDAGGEYVAKFRLRIPEATDYDEAGIHIRTGDDEIVEKDQLYIKSVNIPQTSKIKAAYFDSTGALDLVDYRITNSDAKWANARWNRPLAGIYEIEAVIKVKETASIGNELNIYYRAWAKKDGVIYRSPEDALIETYELYNEPFKATYQVGVVTLCDEDFCFSASVTDIDRQLLESVTDSYSARIFNEYRLFFTLTNNSDKVHNNANIRIRNPEKGVLFTDYTLHNADGQPTSGVLNDYEFPTLGLDAGNLSRNKNVIMDMEFITQKAHSSTINIVLVSDMQAVYSKNISINIAAPYEMEVIVNPTMLPSGIENDINVLVKDKVSGLEIADAVVRATDRHGNVVALEDTGLNGYAQLTLPAQAPGAELSVEVEKPGYRADTVVLTINPEVLEVLPAQIGVALNSTSMTESDDAFSVRNMTAFPLQITDIGLSGGFKNLLDEQQIANWLTASYLNLTIQPGEKVEMALKTYLSEDGKMIMERETLVADLSIEVGNFGQKWYFAVPVTIAIGVGKELDDPTCLMLTKSEWSTATEGQPVVVEFQMQNNCTIDGSPVALRNLQAEVEWAGNQIGEYSLTLNDVETPLRASYFRMLLGMMEPDTTYTAILKFTPFGGVNGLADASIAFRAINPLDTGDQELTARIHTLISAVKLRECLTFSKTELKMDEDSLPDAGAIIAPIGRTDDSFTITTTACGGPVDIVIESELEANPYELTIQDDSESGEIVVSGPGAIPGQYGVFVYGKAPGEHAVKFVKKISALVKPVGCLSLSRYEFDLYDDPLDTYDGYDTAELVNTCYNRIITVKVDTSDLKGMLESAAMGCAGGGLAGWSQGEKKEDGKDGLWQRIKDRFGRGRTPGAGGGECDPPCGADKECVDGTCKPKEEGNESGNDDNDEGCELGGVSFEVGENVKICIDGVWSIYECSDGRVPIPAQGKPMPTGGETCTEEEENTVVKLSAAAGAPPSALASLSSGILPVTGELTFMQFLGIGCAAGAATYLFGDHTTDVDVDVYDVGMGAINVLTGVVSVVAGQVQTAIGALVDTDVGVAEVGTPLHEPKPGAVGLDIETRGLAFTNLSGFTTTEEMPEYRYLHVDAVRYEYDTDKVYGGDTMLGFIPSDWDSDEDDLASDVDSTSQPFAKQFRLEFNSIPPELCGQPGQPPCPGPPPQALDCQAGTKLGATGIDAAPRIELAWDWASIAEDECDVGNPGYIYCDATQFSIEVLKKIGTIQNFLDASGASLQCPSVLDVGSAQSIIGDYDIGISRITVEKVTGGDVKAIVEIENTNPGEITTDLTLAVTDTATGTATSCPTAFGQVQVLSRETRECTFTGLAAGVYTVEAVIDPLIPAECEYCESITASNTLATTFTLGAGGVPVDCEPYTTERLEEFCTASPGVAGCDAVLDSIHFRAHLIKDRYSSDFQGDFDDYAMMRSIFNAPTEYTDSTSGLGIYFRNPGRFSFGPKYGTANPEGYLAQAGIYDVTIDITYEDGTWRLFDASNAENASIRVKLDRSDSPQPDSPFYYLPFDGRIGETDGRVGYGINYRGDAVQVDAGFTPIYTVEIPGSTPITNGTVDVSKVDEFKRVNVTSRGTVLKVTAGQNPSIVYSPSYATPVVMRTENLTGDAWAFYGVGVDSAVVAGNAENTGPSMSRWNGIGVNCKSYSDMLAIEEFRYTADTHGLSANTQCALVPGPQEGGSYGFEFCNPVKYGNLYMESIFYTPQHMSSVMEIVIANEDAQLNIGGGWSSQVMLNGVTGIPDNLFGSDSIDNIADILELVEDGYVCVSGSDISTEFWWNPKAVYASVATVEDEAVNNCIPSA